MKFLAIENETSSENWQNKQNILIDEAKKAYEYFLSGFFREIYFNENHCAVIILECESKEKAKDLLDDLPLVKEKLIEFSLTELKPYTGFSRLM